MVLDARFGVWIGESSASALMTRPAGVSPPASISFTRLLTPATPPRVGRFGTCTADLRDIAAWLGKAGVDTVAMEATGVYWVPLYDLLESEGFRVLLVDPHQIKAAPGRPKTDVKDCMWIQRL